MIYLIFLEIVIPNFPTFKKLLLSDKEEIMEYVKNFPPYSDYNFTSLYSYNTKEEIYISYLNTNLVIRFQDYITNEPFYSFLGTNQPILTAQALIDFAIKHHISPVLRLIPEIVILSEKIESLLIEEDNNNHDYILSVTELALMKGGKYYDKRNLVNRFKKLHSNYETRELDLKSSKIHSEIKNLFHLWKDNRQSDDSAENEFVALTRLLDVADILPIVGIGIYLGNILIGFSIKEIIHDRYSIIHFEKNNHSYPGISSYLRYESANYLHKRGCIYINYEQDLGIEALRKAKTLWRPQFFFKKFTISPK